MAPCLGIEGEQRLERIGCARRWYHGRHRPGVDLVNPVEADGSGEKSRHRLLVGGIEYGTRARRAAQRFVGQPERRIEGMIGFLEGCMLHGIFHGDLHGGNLFVRPDGRTALLDFGITGRLSENRRLAFLRLIMGASMNDVMTQMEALRDLGALPADADLRVIIDDLGLEGPAVDPTTLTPEALTGEIQRTVKALLGYGARMPKELMLFVKNLVFLDGAIATLAPDLDLFAEIAEISLYFARRHGDRIAAEVGMNPNDWQMDLTGMKASFGVDPDEVTSLTYRELQERRKLIGDRLAKKRK